MAINFRAKTTSDSIPEKNKGWEKKGIAFDPGNNTTIYTYRRTFKSGPGHKLGRFALGALIVISSFGFALISKKVRDLFARVELMDVTLPYAATAAKSALKGSSTINPKTPELTLKAVLEEYIKNSNEALKNQFIEKIRNANWEDVSGLQDHFSDCNLFKQKEVATILIKNYFEGPLYNDPDRIRMLMSNLNEYPYQAYDDFLKSIQIPPQDLFKSYMLRTQFIEDALDLSAIAVTNKHKEWLNSLEDQEKSALFNDVMNDLPLSDWIQLTSALGIPFERVRERLDSKPWLELTICQEGLAKGASNNLELKEYLLKRFDEEAIQTREDLTFDELQQAYPSILELMDSNAVQGLKEKLKPVPVEKIESLGTHCRNLLNGFLKGEAPEPLLEEELVYIQQNSRSIIPKLNSVEGEEYLGVLGVILEQLPIDKRIELGKLLMPDNTLFERYHGDAALENFRQDICDPEKRQQLKKGLLLGIVDLSSKVNGTPLLHGLFNATLLDCKQLLDGLVIRWDEQDDKNGNTLLHLLIEKGDQPFAKYLIKEGARVDMKNAAQVSPLQLAKDKGLHELATRIVLQVMGELRREEQAVPSKKKKKLATPIAATIRQAKSLNHLKELNKKDFQKAFGGKIVPKPLRGIGNVFNFAGASVQVWEADTAFLAQIKSLHEEIEALQNQESGSTPENVLKLKALIAEKRKEIERIESERTEAKTRHGVEAGVAMMHAGAYGAKAFNVGWKTVKGSMPLLSACTSAFNVYKTLADLNSVADKIKLLSNITQQIEYEKEVLGELKKGLEDENSLNRIIELKFKELERKSEYLTALRKDQEWGKGLEQISAGTTAVTAVVTLVGAFMFPIALPAIAAKAAMAAGLAPMAYDVISGQLKSYFGSLKESDFEPVTNENFEKRSLSISKRLGIEADNLERTLEEGALKIDDATCKKLLKISGILYDEAQFREEKRVHLLNYLLN